MPDKIDETWNRFLLKVKYSFYSMLVFVIFANPETLRLLNSISPIHLLIEPSGSTTVVGLMLTSGLFFATMLGLMMLPAE